METGVGSHGDNRRRNLAAFAPSLGTIAGAVFNRVNRVGEFTPAPDSANGVRRDPDFYLDADY